MNLILGLNIIENANLHFCISDNLSAKFEVLVSLCYNLKGYCENKFVEYGFKLLAQYREHHNNSIDVILSVQCSKVSIYNLCEFAK
jgi:hypothetical protein